MELLYSQAQPNPPRPGIGWEPRPPRCLVLPRRSQCSLFREVTPRAETRRAGATARELRQLRKTWPRFGKVFRRFGKSGKSGSCWSPQAHVSPQFRNRAKNDLETARLSGFAIVDMGKTRVAFGPFVSGPECSRTRIGQGLTNKTCNRL